jgi:hypothetical protein
MENQENKDFAGKNGFVWWTGIVEDRLDPLKLGRCRVRCVGWHSENKSHLPTEMLPWAIPSYPTNLTQTYAPKDGDMVFGFFLDGENAQNPVMMGIFPSIPLKQANIQEAFSDCRNEEQLKRSPRTPKFRKYYIDGTGIEITERPQANNNPIKIDEPTTSRLARNDDPKHNTIRPIKENQKYTTNTFIKQNEDDSSSDKTVFTSNTFIEERKANALKDIPTCNSKWSEPQTKYNAQYPYNNAVETESGHIQEFDDTPGAERIHMAHRNGSFQEWYPDGDKVEKVTKNNYEIIMKDDHVYIMGNCSITVQGNAEVYVQKNAFLKVDGNFDAKVRGTTTWVSGGNYKVIAPRIDLN